MAGAAACAVGKARGSVRTRSAQEVWRTGEVRGPCEAPAPRGAPGPGGLPGASGPERRGTVRERSVEERLAEAERAGRCVCARTDAENMAFRRRARAGYVVCPYPRTYARAERWEALGPRERALHVLRALGAAHPAWVYCAYSAATAHGLAVPRALLAPVHICAPVRTRARVSASDVLARHGLAEVERAEAAGVAVTSLAQTVLECLLDASFANGLALADSALRTGRVGRPQLAAYVAEKGRGRHGVRRAREVVRLADARARSSAESLLRAAVLSAGFLVPTELGRAVADPAAPRRAVWAALLWRLPGRVVAAALAGGADGAPAGSAAAFAAPACPALRASAVMRLSPARLAEPGYVAGVLAAYGIPRAAGPGWRGGAV